MKRSLDPTAEPPSLFDQPAEDPDLVERVGEHQGTGWKAEALAAVLTAARRHSHITVEDVDWPTAVDNRARGWALREACRRGHLEATGDYVLASERHRHGRPVAVWRSLEAAPWA